MNSTPKVVLITGASSGIGAATAKALAAAGHHVVLGARRTDLLDALVAELGSGSAHQLDVTSKAGFQAFADAALAEHGRIDVLVNNAGVMPLSPMAELRTDEWDRMVDVNLKGVLNGLGAVLPTMLAANSGHLVNVASIAAHEVVPTAAVYSATKFAVRALSDGLRQELSPKGVRVTTVSPGVVESELADTITSPEAAEMMRSYRQVALPASAIGDAIAYAIDQPATVGVAELIVRPS
ncbi:MULTISPECIES: SDR family oxidoreductase [Actinosynnema]|uniref:SDR family oxidoreductase n=1 Tax=Actinosynnema TaxID=40566 RepID=UPI0020A35031|nr:SDR family oxidoreductase [Actinosynnema pretiosum]MCP2097098.1 NADP-dependent 3-hydroxy acid dehydrogenase YdfG [Actinosynnema pretiosum]